MRSAYQASVITHDHRRVRGINLQLACDNLRKPVLETAILVKTGGRGKGQQIRLQLGGVKSRVEACLQGCLDGGARRDANQEALLQG